MDPGKYNVKITKDGYFDFERSFTIEDQDLHKVFKINKIKQNLFLL